MRLSWDKADEKIYQLGVDRGVLYPEGSDAVAWNGLISVDETEDGLATTDYFFDGTKYLIARTLGDFAASLKAYTYPEEFEEYDGITKVTGGLFAYNQPVRKTFGLSYRTMVGNAIQGTRLGYKIHLCYNLSATPDARTYQTLSGPEDPSSFGWSISGIPEQLSGHRPTAHVVLDTRYMPAEMVQALESVLYGSEYRAGRLPTPEELRFFIEDWSTVTIVDNGDGTWTAYGPSSSIYFIGDDPGITEPIQEHFEQPNTIFEIDGADVTYIDEDTYTIKSSSS